MCTGSFDLILAACKARMFLQLQNFVVDLRARRIEEHHAKGVTRPAIVAKEALEARLLDASLIVNGHDGALSKIRGVAEAIVIGLGTAHHGIYERRGSGTKIESGERAAIGRLQDRLILGRRVHQLIGAVGIKVQQFDTRDETAGSLAVGDGFGADEAAPDFRAEMGSVDAAENAVPVSVVALSAEEMVTRGCQFGGAAGVSATRRNGGEAGGSTQHFFVKKIGLGIFAEETAPRAAAKEGQRLGLIG